MREFQDESGRSWVASIQDRGGVDYKGRFGFRFNPKDMPEAEAFVLRDVRWNSSESAERTLGTMSVTELRRRLKIALGRAG